MIKVKVNGQHESDVSEMNAQGWNVCVYREPRHQSMDFITAHKGEFRFVVYCTADDEGDPMICIKKYLNGVCRESKKFYNPNNSINGLLFISEGKTPETTYAFFRNEDLQSIMDEFDVRKIVFPAKDGERFTKVVYDNDTVKASPPPFHTDGIYDIIDEGIINGLRKYEVHGASYIYEYRTSVLTIPWKYDCGKIREQLAEIITKDE